MVYPVQTPRQRTRGWGGPVTHDQGVTVFGFLLRSKNATQRTHGEGEPIPERRDEVMSEPGGHFEPGGCLTSLVDDHGTSWQEG